MRLADPLTSNSRTLIDLNNVTVYRGGKKVFEHFSLTLPRKRNIAVLGPNGAGKSTLLKLLMRELYPVKDDNSNIRILGMENWNVWELRSVLGFISQDLQNRYLGYVTGFEVILSGFYSSVGVYTHQNYRSDEEVKAKEVARQLDIGHLLDKQFQRMSTGEQRRFLLGRALVNEPSALVLDEPTSGLDLNATFKYLNSIRTLMKCGTQIVLVTHHIHEIPPEVDYVIFLKDRGVVSSGEKSLMLNSAALSALYDSSMQVVSANGYYQAVPLD